jgi:hypothetical protein
MSPINPSLYTSSCFASPFVSGVPFPRPKRFASFHDIAPHLKRLIGHSPVRACDQKRTAAGIPNHARFDQSYIHVFFSLSLLNIILNALETIFHHKNTIHPVSARFPTPPRNCFCSGFILL